MESDQPSPVKGVVIITLPPPDNPSLGKTITAFTVSDSAQFQETEAAEEQEEISYQVENQVDNHNQLDTLPIQSLPSPQLQYAGRKLIFGLPRKLVSFLGIALFAFFLYSSVFPRVIQELRGPEDDDGPKSFVFPLYPKLGLFGQTDVELKLGRFVDVDTEKLVAAVDGGLGSSKANKLVSSPAKIDSSTIVPVRGNVYPDGLYYTYIHVGNPPRPYFLDIDSGSDLTWIQCDAPCQNCAKGMNPLYKPTRGNIVPPRDSVCMEVQKNLNIGHCITCKQCDYEIQYADKSSTMGVLARDELHLMMASGSSTKSDIIFGCAYDQQGLLLNTLSKTDGILGLSRSKVSMPSQLASRGIINNVVGHCLTSDVAGGGYMFLGDDFVPQWGMTWIPMLNSPLTDFYQTKSAKIYYGSSLVSVAPWNSKVESVVFDTGSSYTYFTEQAYSNLVDSLQEVARSGLVRDSSDPALPICWRAKFPLRSVMDVKHFFKPITLQFGSRFWLVPSKLEIPPEGYLIISGKGNVCLGILDGSKVHDGSTLILGDISLRGQLVIYDNMNQKIGWARSDCHKPRRVKNLPLF